MPGVPAKYLETFRRLQRATEQLHALIESGEFHTYGYIKRRKLIRRVRKLYRQVVGPVSPAVIGSAVAAVGVLALAGCFPATEEGITPDFQLRDANTIGLGITESSEVAGGGYVALADTDDDGDLDLYFASNYFEAEIVRLSNAGDGSFGPLTPANDRDPDGLDGGYTAYFPTRANRPLHFVDIDDDGDLDLIAKQYYSYSGDTLILVENTGTAGEPTFEAPVPFAESASLPTQYITAAQLVDIDLDSDLDLIVVANPPIGGPYTDFTGYVYFASNTSGSPASFTSAAAIKFPYSANTFGGDIITGLALTDLDNDGDLDVLVTGYAEGSSTIQIRHIENTSTEEEGISFGAPSLNPFGLKMPSQSTNPVPYAPVASLAVGDIDGDGDKDVILGTNVIYGDGYVDTEFFYFENIALPEEGS